MNTNNIAGVNLDNLPVPEMPVPDKYQPWLKFIYPIVAVLIALLAFSLLIIPTLNDAVSLKGETDANGDKAKNLDQKLQVLKSANKDKLNEDLSKLEGALPSDKDAAGFLANVNCANMDVFHPQADGRFAARSRTAATKHSIGGCTIPAPTCPIPGNR